MPAHVESLLARGSRRPGRVADQLFAVDLEQLVVVVAHLERPFALLAVLDLEPALELVGLAREVRRPAAGVAEAAVLVHWGDGVDALDVRPVLRCVPAAVSVLPVPNAGVVDRAHLQRQAVAKRRSRLELKVVVAACGSRFAHHESERHQPVPPARVVRAAGACAVLKREGELVPSLREIHRSARHCAFAAALADLHAVHVEAHPVVVAARERPHAGLLRRHVELAASRKSREAADHVGVRVYVYDVPESARRERIAPGRLNGRVDLVARGREGIKLL